MKYSVSIIIIAFNTVDYIKYCLDSVFSQNFKDFEVIIVDNASTDGTATIIKNYIAEKQNVVFLQNDKNLGGAAAGNIGIKKARGEYVFIMDSDDIMPSDTLKTLYHCAKSHSSDIVIGRAKSIYGDKIKNFKFKFYSIPYSLTGTYKQLSDCKELLISPFYWGRLYKTELLQKNNIYMPEGFVFADMYFNSKALKFAKNITVCEHLSYLWRRFGKNETHVSITSSENQTQIFADRLQSYYDLEEIFSEPEYADLLKSMRLYNLLRLLIPAKFAAKDATFAKLYFEEMYKYLQSFSYDDIKDCIYMTSKKKLLCYLIKEKRFNEFVNFSSSKEKLKTEQEGTYAVVKEKLRPHNVPLGFLRHTVRKPKACHLLSVNKIFNHYKFSFEVKIPTESTLSVLRAVLSDKNGNEIYLSHVQGRRQSNNTTTFYFYIPQKVLRNIFERNKYYISAEMLINNNFCSTLLTYKNEDLIIRRSTKKLTLNGKPIEKY